MTNEPNPRPWTFCQTYGEHRPNSIIVDADGGNVALVCHFANEEEENRIGNLIVDAVNHIEETKRLSIKLYEHIKRAEAQRDRLRDLVKRFLDLFTPGTTIHPAGTMEHLLREARAAIGEDAHE